MSMLKQLIDGSLVSRQRLMQAREFYSPSHAQMPVRSAFARWTERALEQAPLTIARELSGLSGPELDELEAEFVSCPLRPAPRWVRPAVIAGGLLILLATLGFGLPALAALGERATRILQAPSVVCLLSGLLVVGTALISAFRALPLDLSYGTTGLYVGKLDEQHPWLYSALSLTTHRVAEEYRQRILRERGALRGADYVMMRELVQAHERLESVRGARSVAEQLQRSPVAAQPLIHEPRLVRVGAPRDSGEMPELDVSRAASK